MEGVVGPVAEVGVDATDGEVHLRQPPCRCGVLLPVDGDVTASAAMRCHELGRLDEHAP